MPRSIRSLPVTDDFRSKPLVCNVSKDSQHAEVLRRAKLIVWDESTASHVANVDAVDRMLRDVTGVDRLFGARSSCSAGRCSSRIRSRLHGK